MSRVEDVIFFAALMPAELTVKPHVCQRLPRLTVFDHPIRMLAKESTAIPNHERRDPQSRDEPGRADILQQRFHPTRELRLDLQPVAHLGSEPVVDLEDAHWQFLAPGNRLCCVQMIQDVFFVDGCIQVVPGAPARDRRGTEARWSRGCVRREVRPGAQPVLNLRVTENDQSFRFVALQPGAILAVPQGLDGQRNGLMM
jgi:hypothetical protein